MSLARESEVERIVRAYARGEPEGGPALGVTVSPLLARRAFGVQLHAVL